MTYCNLRKKSNSVTANEKQAGAHGNTNEFFDACHKFVDRFLLN